MERLAQNGVDGEFDSAYSSDLVKNVKHVTAKGAYAMVCPHNYGRYKGEIITDVKAFGSFWTKLATLFKDDPLVVFDINNEFNTMQDTLVAQLNQAGIDAIRAAGATQQYITPEGNAWSGAWSWVSSGNGASLKDLKDPQNKLVYQMHQYLDDDHSGTHDTCTSPTALADGLKDATDWLRTNKKLGVIGEFATGNNDVCFSALKGGLAYMAQNSDVWMGGVWWAAGPWWGGNRYSLEPGTGVSWNGGVMDILKPYFPGASSSSS